MGFRDDGRFSKGGGVTPFGQKLSWKKENEEMKVGESTMRPAI